MGGDDHTERPAGSAVRRRISYCVWLALILIAVGFIVVRLWPDNWDPTSPDSRNLKKIGLALCNYAQKYGRFPPAYTLDKQGRRMHSWRVLVLEFLDHDLSTQYDFSRPWNSPGNLAFAKKMRKDGPYRCPSEDIKEPSWTSYVMLVGPTAFSNGPTGRKVEEIAERDGATSTAAVIEMSPSGILWTAPDDLNVDEMSFKIGDPEHVCPRGHVDGVHVLFADSHVEFFSAGECDEAHLKAVVTINGGEDMSKF
jgi:hypothetical protein